MSEAQPEGERGFFDEEPSHRQPSEEQSGRRSRRSSGRRDKRRGGGCLPVLLALAVLGAIGWFGGNWAYDQLSDRFGPPADYAGAGTDPVLFEVKAGQSSTAIGQDLKAAGVVKSVDAFADAALQNPESTSIQVGFYELKKKMKASTALEVLVKPENLMQSAVLVREGARVKEIVAEIAAKTHIKAPQVQRALKQPAAIGLPAYAKGNPEGYLFPATYAVAPNMTAEQLVKQMVVKTVQVMEENDVTARAQALQLTPEQLLTVASILEWEANNKADYPKVARVIYNRLESGQKLEMDSTVTFITGREGDVYTTEKERQIDSPYNTYLKSGLPPGPIGSAGAATIEAALNPAKGNWLYFVPDIENGTTLFTDDYKEHQRNAAKLAEFCRSSEKC